jgi:hypothetical protein
MIKAGRELKRTLFMRELAVILFMIQGQYGNILHQKNFHPHFCIRELIRTTLY